MHPEAPPVGIPEPRRQRRAPLGYPPQPPFPRILGGISPPDSSHLCDEYSASRSISKIYYHHSLDAPFHL